MGGCTSDIYSTLKKEHGEVFKKLIIGSQSLTMLKREVKMKLQELDRKVQQNRQNLHAEVNQREEVMMFHFNETKMNIDGSIPGGINDYEQMKKVNIENILNFPEYKSRFNNVHKQIDQQFHSRKKIVHQELEHIIIEAQKESTIDAQKIVLYHQMAEQRRAQIRHKGMKQFEKQIRAKISAMELKYANQLNLEAQIKRFQNVISLEKVDQLAKMAENKFKAEALQIIGGNLDSSIKV